MESQPQRLKKDLSLKIRKGEDPPVEDRQSAAALQDRRCHTVAEPGGQRGRAPREEPARRIADAAEDVGVIGEIGAGQPPDAVAVEIIDPQGGGAGAEEAVEVVEGEWAEERPVEDRAIEAGIGAAP